MIKLAVHSRHNKINSLYCVQVNRGLGSDKPLVAFEVLGVVAGISSWVRVISEGRHNGLRVCTIKSELR